MAKILKSEEEVYQAVLTGMLEIDHHGRIWRIKSRTGNRWTGKAEENPCRRRRAENKTGLGYLQIRVMYAGIRHHAAAHRLVWRHFHGPIPKSLTINHKNGKKSDNRPENLEVMTESENQKHAVHVLGTAKAANQWGENNSSMKLTDQQVKEIKKRRATGEKLNSIAKDYRIAFQTVSKIARRERRYRG